MAGPYDAFAFSPNLPPTHGSPDPAAAATPMHVGSIDSGVGDVEDSRASRTRSSSEEKEAALTPAQSRRKAQNRAAYVSILFFSVQKPPKKDYPTDACPHSQRAFRERKERHVRDLEAKLTALESSTHTLQSDNDRLKLALQRARTENEILRATTAASPPSSRPVSASYPSPGAHLPDESSAGDEPYNVQDLPTGSVLVNADRDTAAARRPHAAREIPAAQTWDFIQTHPLVKQGLVDIADVCERLKGAARCDGNGPVYEETIVWAAIESARRSGGDELI